MINQQIARIEDYLCTQHMIAEKGHQNMNKHMMQSTNCYKCVVKFSLSP